MKYVHILCTPVVRETPPWRTDEKYPKTAGKRVWTDCCGCKMPSEQTDASYRSYYDPPLGGGVALDDLPTGAWYGADIRIVCHQGFGCTVKPTKKNGRELREMWRYGP